MESAVFLVFFGAIFARQEVLLLFLKVCCCAPVCEFAVESNRKDVRKSWVDAWQLSEIIRMQVTPKISSATSAMKWLSCNPDNNYVKHFLMGKPVAMD